jgi:hypothetical protein
MVMAAVRPPPWGIDLFLAITDYIIMKIHPSKISTRALFWIALLSSLLCINIGFSLESTTEATGTQYDGPQGTEAAPGSRADVAPEIDVGIQFHNRRIYYVGDPIVVEFQITNRGSKPYLFLTSFDEVFTFDFEVASFSNRMVEHSTQYAIERTKFEPVMNDEITLKPFEVYGARIDIGRWFDLREPGEYIIRGNFFPNLVTDPASKIPSANELYLSLNPAFTETHREKRREDEIVRLKAEKLPPYEVVEFLLESLIKKDFDKYFIYVNFDQFIRQFDNAKKKYLSARDIDKPAVVEDFKRYLKGENKLEGIPFADTIPVDYQVVKTVIEGRNAQVTVIQTFRYLRYLEKKQYTYLLHQYGDKWLLDRYQVVNIGF